jgi:hypothetical protein
MAYRRPKKGDVRVFNGVKVRFGLSGGFRHDEDVKRFANSPGAGLYARGIDPESPTVEQDTLAWLKRYRENPNNRKGQAGYNRAFSEAQYGRDDARQPGLKTLMAQNPNAPVHALFDMTARNYQAQNALAPRDFDVMTILDPIIATGLGFINPALSAAYMGGRTAGEGGDFLDIALSAGGGYLGGMSGASLKAGVSAAGGWANYARNIGSSIANAPSNALNYLKYGPEMTSAQFASNMPDWVRSGTAAGMSNAARAAGAIGSLNNPGRAGVTSTAGAGPGGSNMSWFSNVMQDWGVTKGDLFRAGIDVVSGIRNANAVENAARMQANAAQQAANIGSQTSQQQMQLARDIFAQQTALNEPFRQGGVNALNRMQDLLGISGNRNAPGYGSMSKNFTMADFQADPGYAFRMTEGLKALDRQAAARGGLISGGALKAAQGYGQDLASQEYLNAFNRFQTNRTNLLNPLQSIAGAGQTATTTLSQAGQNMGTNVANYMGNAGQAQAGAVTSAADARASGYLGAQEGWNRAINSALSRGTTPDQQLQRDYINALIRNTGDGRNRSGMLNFAGVG